ncbi:hypothetical protein C0J52_05698, partial [Blattella germanica]
YDLCQAFLAADIPLYKINNPTLKHFLGKYTRQHVPEESTLCKTCVGRCYNNVLSKLQIELADQSSSGCLLMKPLIVRAVFLLI